MLSHSMSSMLLLKTRRIVAHWNTLKVFVKTKTIFKVLYAYSTDSDSFLISKSTCLLRAQIFHFSQSDFSKRSNFKSVPCSAAVISLSRLCDPTPGLMKKNPAPHHIHPDLQLLFFTLSSPPISRFIGGYSSMAHSINNPTKWWCHNGVWLPKTPHVSLIFPFIAHSVKYIYLIIL